MAIAENKFIHHVYFWLNNPNSVEDKNSLIEGSPICWSSCLQFGAWMISQTYKL